MMWLINIDFVNREHSPKVLLMYSYCVNHSNQKNMSCKWLVPNMTTHACTHASHDVTYLSLRKLYD